MPTTMTKADDGLLQTFTPWSSSHWAAIFVTALVALALSAARRRLRHEPRAERALDRAFAAFAAATWVATQILQATLDEFPATTALPFHVSDLTALAVPLALWTSGRWFRAVLYSWGLTLASLAFLLPDLRAGPERLGYWLFWLPHTLILSAVVYDLAARGFRPTWADYRRAAIVSVVYAMLIAPFNTVTGSRYGYLGPPRPGEPAVLKWFGPWPWRIVPIVACGLAAMALLTLPWTLGGPPSAPASPDRT
jgi:hypothetical integral membrane protein (TIGR02206 family)